MKRYTNTTVWQEPWHRRLTGAAKMLWRYLNDQADPAGVVILDFDLATLDCGMPITAHHLTELADKVSTDGPKVLLTNFIADQYGRLSPKCFPHRKVYAAINEHNLTEIAPGHYAFTPKRFAPTTQKTRPKA